MEVKICVPAGTPINTIEAEYPDIYQDDADADGYDIYFIGASSEEDANERDSPNEWLTWEEAIECCGFVEGLEIGAETLMEGSGEWAMAEARNTDIYKKAFGRGRASNREEGEKMKIDDRIEITKVDEETDGKYFQVGDKATLSYHDGEVWWADFDNRTWGNGDNRFAVSDGDTEYKIIK